jgi:hypothetical protein
MASSAAAVLLEASKLPVCWGWCWCWCPRLAAVPRRSLLGAPAAAEATAASSERLVAVKIVKGAAAYPAASEPSKAADWAGPTAAAAAANGLGGAVVEAVLMLLGVLGGRTAAAEGSSAAGPALTAARLL